MHLSKLTLNPRHRQVQRDLANPYQLHRTLMSGFPETLSEGERVLHRLETDPRSGSIIVLVQSQTPPDWSHLANGQEYLLDAPATKQFEPTLIHGQQLRFRLRANPTAKTWSERNPVKKTRVPLVHEEKQIAWLERKGTHHGFRILEQRISHTETHRGRKRRGGATIMLYTIQFDGILQVTDAEKFADALASGIGPAKAFGCGLLSIAPAR